MANIFVCNIGATSTKIAWFENERSLIEKTIRYQTSDFKGFKTIFDQQTLRTQDIEKVCAKNSIDLASMDVIVVRGGVVKPLGGGIYAVDETVLEDIKSSRYGTHASNLGLLIGYDWKKRYKVDVIFVDPPTTDELSLLARYTGLKGYMRSSIFHALNQKQTARNYAASVHKNLDNLRLVIVHAGGGISISACKYGRMVDVNNALDGEGPFTPSRVGGISSENVLRLVKENDGDLDKTRNILLNQGGLMSYFDTHDMQSLVQQMDSNQEIEWVIDAMIYQIAKEVGAMATVLRGKVDQILLTGGLIYNQEFVLRLTRRIEWIASVTSYPGEDELLALAMGGYRYLTKEEECLSYN
jgi:butyrate kinase